jgi:hypothetical protein
VDAERFDQVTRKISSALTRRAFLPRVLAVVAGLGTISTARANGPKCRGAAEICNGNAVCCGDLQCMPTGIGNQHRCLEPLPPPPPPQ